MSGSAIALTAAYIATDILEVGQGHFSTVRLALIYAGEAAIPLFVLGLYAVQRPRIGRLGLFGVDGQPRVVMLIGRRVSAALRHVPSRRVGRRYDSISL